MSKIERPDIKVLYVWRAEVLTGWGIVFLIILGFTIFLVVAADAPVWSIGFAGIPFFFGALGLMLLKLRWKNWTFELTDHTLEMSHGWFIRHRRIVSRNRIQHVDFNTGPIGRKLNLVHVIVHTAGANVGTIPGITSERAELLRTELMSGPKSL